MQREEVGVALLDGYLLEREGYGDIVDCVWSWLLNIRCAWDLEGVCIWSHSEA